MEVIINADQAQGAGAVPIIESSTEGFMTDVIDASNDLPVIVDFWAPWCGPCKQLTPALEKLVTAARGAVKLVKINVDENPELQMQLRIQSIPMVFAFFGGQPVDAFQGALPESQLKSWIDRLVQDHGGGAPASPVDEALEAAEAATAAGDFGSAAALFTQVIGAEPTRTAAIAGLAKCHIQLGALDDARQLLDGVDEEAAKTADIAAARSALELAEGAAHATGERGTLEARLAADENDHQARYDLALADYGAGNADAAIEALLTIVRRSRAWNDEAARKQLLKIFEALGPTHELTVDGRRQLSSILFS